MTDRPNESVFNILRGAQDDERDPDVRLAAALSSLDADDPSAVRTALSELVRDAYRD